MQAISAPPDDNIHTVLVVTGQDVEAIYYASVGRTRTPCPSGIVE